MISHTIYDVFVSYASEDQMTVVEPLVAGLRELGILVWYAPLVLRVGDHLRRSLDRGIAQSRYGIVVLSPAFLSKHWTQYELDGLAQMEVEGRKVILPVWYEIEAAELRQRSSPLADRIAVRWSNGLQRVLADLISVIRPHKKSERRYQLERLAFTRLYHLEDATVPAVRLVGAATEHFPVDTISIALDSQKYAMPEPFTAQRDALVAALEEEVSQRGGSVFNGPCVRMSDYTIEYPNVASERKHLKLVLSQLEYYDYAIMRRVSDATMLDGTAEKIDSLLDIEKLLNTGSVRSNRLSNIVDTATTIMTKDGALLYANRTQQVGDRGGWFTSAVAETLHAEKDKVFIPDAGERRGAPYRTVVRGIAEELSPELADVASRARLKPLLLGISFDLEGFHPDLLFLWLTELRAGEVLTSIRNHPGKDFFEGRIRSLDMSMGLHDVVRALTSERWTPGGAASVVRGLEFLAAACTMLGTKDSLSAVNCLLEEGIGALDVPSSPG